MWYLNRPETVFTTDHLNNGSSLYLSYILKIFLESAEFFSPRLLLSDALWLQYLSFFEISFCCFIVNFIWIINCWPNAFVNDVSFSTHTISWTFLFDSAITWCHQCFRWWGAFQCESSLPLRSYATWLILGRVYLTNLGTVLRQISNNISIEWWIKPNYVTISILSD